MARGEVHCEPVARKLPRECEPVRVAPPTQHVLARRDVARERFSWLLEAVTSNG